MENSREVITITADIDPLTGVSFNADYDIGMTQEVELLTDVIECVLVRMKSYKKDLPSTMRLVITEEVE